MRYGDDLRMMIKLLEQQGKGVMPLNYDPEDETITMEAQEFVQTDEEKLKTLTSILKLIVDDMELSEQEHDKTYKITTVLQSLACLLCVVATILVKLGVL